MKIIATGIKCNGCGKELEQIRPDVLEMGPGPVILIDPNDYVDKSKPDEIQWKEHNCFKITDEYSQIDCGFSLIHSFDSGSQRENIIRLIRALMECMNIKRDDL